MILYVLTRPLHPELIKRTVCSNHQRLLNELEPGKPLQLLRRCASCGCGGDGDNTILCELLLQRLSNNVCMVLAPSGNTLNNLAEMADRILEVSTPTITAVHSVPTSVENSLCTEVQNSRLEQPFTYLPSFHVTVVESCSPLNA